MIRITFLPLNRTVEATPGERISEIADRAGLEIISECGGSGKCGTCLVGFDAKSISADTLSVPKSREKQFLPEDADGISYRLACLTRIYKDAVVHIAPESRDADNSPRKPFSKFSISIQPAVEKRVITISKDSMAKPDQALSDRIREAIVRDGKQELSGPDLSVMARFSENPEFLQYEEITATIYRGRQIIQLCPGRHSGLFGVALDLGTTSIVAFLCDLKNDKIVGSAAMHNPQVTFGSDVISRIARIRKDPSKLKVMQDSIIEAINDLIRKVSESVDISMDDIVDIVAVGNPTMQHIFLGLNPAPLGVAPYMPVCCEGGEVDARHLNLYALPSARVHVLPLLSGFIGSDTLAAMITPHTDDLEGTWLMVDVGTNGELVLVKDGVLTATSCATGPVFEGTQIKCGMRASAGAIDKVFLGEDSGTFRCRVIADQATNAENRPLGFCGSGIISAVSALIKSGLVDKDGGYDIDGGHSGIRIDPESGIAEMVMVPAAESKNGRDIVITQLDIRAVQLGKAALRAGVEILMKNADVASLDKILLAGTFGNYLDPHDLMTIGMLPPIDIEKIRPIGNAAGDGARLALFSLEIREKAIRRAKRIKVVELSMHPDLLDVFVDAMMFP